MSKIRYTVWILHQEKTCCQLSKSVSAYRLMSYFPQGSLWQLTGQSDAI